MAQKPPLVSVYREGQPLRVVPILNFKSGFSVSESTKFRGVDITSGGGFVGPSPVSGSTVLVMEELHSKGAGSAVATSPAAAVVSGGNKDTDDTVPSKTIEKYNAQTQEWAVVGQLDGARAQHTQITLRDGKILILGGYSAPAPLFTPVYNVELFDPVTGLTTSAFKNQVVTKTIPAGGLVPLTAGDQPGAMYTALGGFVACNVISPGTPYPPTAASLPGQSLFTQVPGAPAPGQYQITAAVPGASTLQFNAADSGIGKQIAINFIYQTNPIGPSFPAPMLTLMGEVGGILLDDGRVLLVAGDPGHGVGPASDKCQIYDPSTGGWVQTGSLLQARQTSTRTVVKLSDGRVLVAGGSAISKRTPGYDFLDVLSSCEIWDPAFGIWAPAAQMGIRRAEHTMKTLSNGNVICVGGYGEVPNLAQPTARADVYNPQIDTWLPVGSMIQARANATISKVRDGVLIYGGYADSVPETGLIHDAESFDQVAGYFQTTESPVPADAGSLGVVAVELPGNQVIHAGGGTSNDHLPTKSCALYQAQ